MWFIEFSRDRSSVLSPPSSVHGDEYDSELKSKISQKSGEDSVYPPHLDISSMF